MKLVALCYLVAVVAAAPAPRQNYKDNVQLLRYENEYEGNGRYKYAFEQSDGTRQEQQGQIKNEGQEDGALAVSGSYSWIGPDGQRIVVNYVADENGYQPTIEEGPGALPPAAVASLLG